MILLESIAGYGYGITVYGVARKLEPSRKRFAMNPNVERGIWGRYEIVPTAGDGERKNR